MAAKNDHTERSRQENDNQWRTLLNTPGLSKTDMVNAYSDWAKNGNFDMVCSFRLFLRFLFSKQDRYLSFNMLCPNYSTSMEILMKIKLPIPT